MSEVKWTNEQLNAIKEDRNNVLVAAAREVEKQLY